MHWCFKYLSRFIIFWCFSSYIKFQTARLSCSNISWIDRLACGASLSGKIILMIKILWKFLNILRCIWLFHDRLWENWLLTLLLKPIKSRLLRDLFFGSRFSPRLFGNFCRYFFNETKKWLYSNPLLFIKIRLLSTALFSKPFAMINLEFKPDATAQRAWMAGKSFIFLKV